MISKVLEGFYSQESSLGGYRLLSGKIYEKQTDISWIGNFENRGWNVHFLLQRRNNGEVLVWMHQAFKLIKNNSQVLQLGYPSPTLVTQIHECVFSPAMSCDVIQTYLTFTTVNIKLTILWQSPIRPTPDYLYWNILIFIDYRSQILRNSYMYKLTELQH